MKKKPRHPDRRLARNRTALMKAAEFLFGRKGADQVTIDEIAETAELAKGTFYHYFEDKDAIAREVALETRRAVEIEVSAAQAGVEDPAERLVLGISVFLRGAVKEPSRAGIVAQMYPQWLSPESAGNEQLRQDLADGYRLGRFAGADPGAALVMTVGLVQAGIKHVIAINDANAARGLAVSLCRLELRALGLRWNQAQGIAAKAVRRVFDQDRQTPPP
jgi:AcrR family transcriptional regulator